MPGPITEPKGRETASLVSPKCSLQMNGWIVRDMASGWLRWKWIHGTPLEVEPYWLSVGIVYHESEYEG